MRKAKIMLMAITTFGIAGGALAYKASKFFGATYYCLTTVNNQKAWVQNYTTINVGDICTAGFTKITTQTLMGAPSGIFNNATYYGFGVQTTLFIFPGE